MRLTRGLGFDWNDANEALSSVSAARTHSACARVTTELPQSRLSLWKWFTLAKDNFNKFVLLCSRSLLFHLLLDRIELASILSIE